jgi:hypothetical protein
MFIFRLGQKIEEMVNLSTTALWRLIISPSIGEHSKKGRLSKSLIVSALSQK